ncbi:MAG: hypothetical protein HC854_04000 [Flavobacterium sp.]|nr:hypothetical protein [Flavobacterium sp.]
MRSQIDQFYLINLLIKMSQEIKNTLFRFVTMRAPELSNEETQEKRFVKRPTQITVKSFDLAVKNKPTTTTKWAAMQNYASTFDAFENKEEVEVIKQKFV